MFNCQWCGNEEELEKKTVLEIYLPHYKGPRFHINNMLCEKCSLASRQALATVEMAARKGSDTPVG